MSRPGRRGVGRLGIGVELGVLNRISITRITIPDRHIGDGRYQVCQLMLGGSLESLCVMSETGKIYCAVARWVSVAVLCCLKGPPANPGRFASVLEVLRAKVDDAITLINSDR